MLLAIDLSSFYYHLMSLLQQPERCVVFITPVLLRKKPRHQEEKLLAQGCAASEGRGCVPSLGCRDPEFFLLVFMLYCLADVEQIAENDLKSNSYCIGRVLKALFARGW